MKIRLHPAGLVQWETLRQLVSMPMPYDSPQIIDALNGFGELERQWNELE